MARFCLQCGSELVAEARFCGRCGASAQAGGDMAAEAAGKSSSRVFKGCLLAFALFWVIGVAAQVGWILWKDHKKAAADAAFFAVARPLLGDWRVINDPSMAQFNYRAVLKPKSAGGAPDEASEMLYLECADDSAAPAWAFAKVEEGRLVGGGMDQRPAGGDFLLATGTAEVDSGGKRLTLRMKWDGGSEVVTVFERAESAQPTAP